MRRTVCTLAIIAATAAGLAAQAAPQATVKLERVVVTGKASRAAMAWAVWVARVSGEEKIAAIGSSARNASAQAVPRTCCASTSSAPIRSGGVSCS